MFVAGFIGSPSMNFLPATLSGTPEAMMLRIGDLDIRLPAERSPALAPHLGQAVTAGIRPEDMHHPDFLPARVPGYAIRARLDVSDMMGNEKFLHLLTAGQPILARVDPRTRARPGQDIDLTVDIDRLHVFDTTSEAALATIPIPDELREQPRETGA